MREKCLCCSARLRPDIILCLLVQKSNRAKLRAGRVPLVRLGDGAASQSRPSSSAKQSRRCNRSEPGGRSPIGQQREYLQTPLFARLEYLKVAGFSVFDPGDRNPGMYQDAIQLKSLVREQVVSESVGGEGAL